MVETYDHTGTPVVHGRVRANGIRMHYVTAGNGPPLLLVHGTPKTHFYWNRLIPLLTAHHTVVAPDLRGFGDTARPAATEGYDSATNAADLVDLMTALGHDRFHVHGEDRGAEFAYVLAASNPDKVLSLSFAEMLLSGQGLEEWSHFTQDNVNAQFDQRGVWQWHLPFFYLPNIPEMLITGREREFWEYWMKAETWNPAAFGKDELDEWIGHLSAPGGLRGVLETYRAAFRNAAINDRLKEARLQMPVMTIGAPEFFGGLVTEQMKAVADCVVASHVFQQCGHSIALEAPDRLATALLELTTRASSY